MPIDRQVQKVLKEFERLGAPSSTPLSPQEARRAPTISDAVNLLRQKRRERLAPEPLGATDNQLIEGLEGEIPLRIYRPVGNGPFPALVYFHSGGWVLGDLNCGDALCRALANLVQCLVVSVGYRLAPEHQFPTAAQDAYAAMQWVIASAILNSDPARLAVVGEGAGANLAAAAALMARDSGTPLPLYQALVYPVTNYAFDTPSYTQHANAKPLSGEMMRWFWGQYLPDAAAGAHPYASPLRAADLRGLPRAFILTAEYDPVRDEGEAYAQRLQEVDVPAVLTRYNGMTHGFLDMAPVVEKARGGVLAVASALRAAFSRDQRAAKQTQLPRSMTADTQIQTGLQMILTGQILQQAPTASTAQVAGDQIASNTLLSEETLCQNDNAPPPP